MAKETIVEESQDFKDDFFKQLKNSVIPTEPEMGGNKTDRLADLLARKEQLARALDEETDSIKKMTLRNEIAEVEAEIGKIKGLDELDEQETAEEDLDDDAKKADEDKAKEAEEQDLAAKEQKEREEAEKKQREARSLALREQYHEALVALYNHKVVSAEEAKAAQLSMISKDAFERELQLESEMYRLRDEYLSLGNEDPYTELRTELIKKERIAVDPMEAVIRKDAREFAKFQKEIVELDAQIAEIDRQIADEQMTEGVAEKLRQERVEIEAKKSATVKRATVLKEKLTPIVAEKARRSEARVELDAKLVETFSTEDSKNYQYQQKQANTITKNTEQGLRQEYRHLNERINKREDRIVELKEQLSRTPIDDFEGRLNILAELDREATLLQADRDSRTDLKRKDKLTPEQRAKKAKEREEEIETRAEDFYKATDDTRDLVRAQNKFIGEDVVANPVKNTVTEPSERNIKTVAATHAIIAGGPNDSLSKNYLEYQSTKQILIATADEEVTPSVIPGLEDKVVNIEDVEEAQKYLEQNDELARANEELLRQQKQVEERTADID
ncbi:MAG: hypothetical protein IKL68_02585 [Clostridia bacterium]|nr:hypothetical protein [Clostridia bacterium]